MNYELMNLRFHIFNNENINDDSYFIQKNLAR